MMNFIEITYFFCFALVTVTIAALQESISKIETLETEVAALKAA